jgi:hypothetical protein
MFQTKFRVVEFPTTGKQAQCAIFRPKPHPRDGGGVCFRFRDRIETWFWPVSSRNLQSRNGLRAVGGFDYTMSSPQSMRFDQGVLLDAL